MQGGLAAIKELSSGQNPGLGTATPAVTLLLTEGPAVPSDCSVLAFANVDFIVFQIYLPLPLSESLFLKYLYFLINLCDFFFLLFLQNLFPPYCLLVQLEEVCSEEEVNHRLTGV